MRRDLRDGGGAGKRATVPLPRRRGCGALRGRLPGGAVNYRHAFHAGNFADCVKHALLVWLLARPTEQVVEQGIGTTQSLLVGGVDLGRQVTDGVNTLRTTLAGITDPASAQAALPRLRQATAQIDKVSGMAGQLSDVQRRALAGVTGPPVSTLNQLFDKVLAIPGVAEIIKPTIDTLRASLARLTA